MTLPTASELALSPGEETPEVTRKHNLILKALVGQNLPAAQSLTADLLDHLETRAERPAAGKTLRLIDFVVLLS